MRLRERLYQRRADLVSRTAGGGEAEHLDVVAFLVLDLRVLFVDGGQDVADFFFIQFLREAVGDAVATKEINAEQFFALPEDAKAQ